jgi:hypothetical protein
MPLLAAAWLSAAEAGCVLQSGCGGRSGELHGLFSIFGWHIISHSLLSERLLSAAACRSLQTASALPLFPQLRSSKQDRKCIV